MSTFHTLTNTLVTLLFALASYLFFSTFYASHLHYHEQYQLFLLEGTYFKESLSLPGGLAHYLGQFITQFYYHSWLGALLLTLLLLLLQQAVWRVSRLFRKNRSLYLLSFLPSVAAWYFLCDENSMLSLLVALILALVTTWLLQQMPHKGWRLFNALLFVPLLYWYLGGASFLFVLLTGFKEFHRTPYRQSRYHLLFLTIMVVITLSTPLFIQDKVHYPLANLYLGIGYYRYPALFPLGLLLALTATAIIPASFKWLPLLPKKQEKQGVILQLIALVGITSLSIYYGANMEREEEMRYDYLARQGAWDRILGKAMGKMPTAPLSVGCVNLALGRTGQLGERMFDFYQNGTEGILPSFERDFSTPLVTSEAYYHLGLINSAQHFTFEAMEALPNHQKSARCYKRLAETNLINGEYKVAQKYLRALSHTLFYREWAEETATYLYNETAINSHSEWGWLRQIRCTEDFFFSEREMESLLERLVRHNPQNRLAFEYRMGYLLQQKRMDLFLNSLSQCETMGYKALPKSYQEAIAYAWVQKNQSFQGMPPTVSAAVVQNMQAFMQLYAQEKSLSRIPKARFGNTYWYYLLSTNSKQPIE
ncbi:MAG: DUF6057 family protein [Phocaeicola sp.]